MDGARKSSEPASKSTVGAGQTPARENSRSRTRSYSQAAMRQCQFRTSDLIPKQFLTFGWIALALVAIMAALNLFSRFSISIDLATALPKYDRLSAFSMAGSQGLTAWFSSFLLILTSLASLQVYALRQHRSNDYRGTYRVWMWLAVFLLLASVNCIVDIEAAGRQLARGWNLTSGGDHSSLPIIVKLSCLAILVVRGIIEIRSSPTSIALVAVVWLAYSLAIAVQMPAVNRNIVFEFDPTYGNSMLLGSIALLLSVLVYARLVLLQSLGLAATARMASKASKGKSSKSKTTRGKSRSRSKVTSDDANEVELKHDEDESAEDDREDDDAENTSTGDRQISSGRTSSPVVAPAVAKSPSPQSSNSPQLPLTASSRSAPVSSPGKGPLQAKMSIASSASSDDDEDEDDEDQQHDGQRPMSKAERRKLRKAQSQQQRRAA